jgi:hypothetical protein
MDCRTPGSSSMISAVQMLPPPNRHEVPLVHLTDQLARSQTRARMKLVGTVAIGAAAAILSIVADWAVVRAIYGDRFAGHAGLHVRFGPKASISQLENPDRSPNR